MKNMLQDEDRYIEVTAPYDVAAGAGCKVGTIFGIAVTTVLSGARVVLDTRGVYRITAASAAVIAVGGPVYWDDSAKNVTNTATSNLHIGAATVAKANLELTADVRLAGMPAKAVG